MNTFYSEQYDSAYCIYAPNAYQTATVWYQSDESMAAKLDLLNLLGADRLAAADEVAPRIGKRPHAAGHQPQRRPGHIGAQVESGSPHYAGRRFCCRQGAFLFAAAQEAGLYQRQLSSDAAASRRRVRPGLQGRDLPRPGACGPYPAPSPAGVRAGLCHQPGGHGLHRAILPAGTKR